MDLANNAVGRSIGASTSNVIECKTGCLAETGVGGALQTSLGGTTTPPYNPYYPGDDYYGYGDGDDYYEEDYHGGTL